VNWEIQKRYQQIRMKFEARGLVGAQAAAKSMAAELVIAENVDCPMTAAGIGYPLAVMSRDRWRRPSATRDGTMQKTSSQLRRRRKGVE
jgi:hypothetical protein